MATIKEINRSNIRIINEDVFNALQTVAKKHGVVIDIGNSSFTKDNYSTKVNVSVVRNGNVLSREAKAFNTYKESWKLEHLSIDSFVKTWNGKVFKIVGAKPRSTKYPLLAENKNGKVYKLTVESVRHADVVNSF